MNNLHLNRTICESIYFSNGKQTTELHEPPCGRHSLGVVEVVGLRGRQEGEVIAAVGDARRHESEAEPEPGCSDVGAENERPDDWW